MLVNGREARLPLSLELPFLNLAHQLELLENDVISIRYAKLIELEEVRERAMQTLGVHQGQVNKCFDKKATFRTFKVGDLVLK